MSRQIRTEKARYYEILEYTQKGDSDITPWLEWSLECYARGAEFAVAVIEDVSRASRFRKAFQHIAFSARQNGSRAIVPALRRQHRGQEMGRARKNVARLRSTRHLAIDRIGCARQNPGGSKNTTYAILEPSD